MLAVRHAIDLEQFSRTMSVLTIIPGETEEHSSLSRNDEPLLLTVYAYPFLLRLCTDSPSPLAEQALRDILKALNKADIKAIAD